eukprot:2005325-Alexandrium_andersonii.AAC.1
MRESDRRGNEHADVLAERGVDSVGCHRQFSEWILKGVARASALVIRVHAVFLAVLERSSEQFNMQLERGRRKQARLVHTQAPD